MFASVEVSIDGAEYAVALASDTMTTGSLARITPTRDPPVVSSGFFPLPRSVIERQGCPCVPPGAQGPKAIRSASKLAWDRCTAENRPRTMRHCY